MLESVTCRKEHFHTDWYKNWSKILRQEPPPGVKFHRKVWEFCAIPQALDERGFLKPGKQGLGFAVGSEPLASLFASKGVIVEATDLGGEGKDVAHWVAHDQHADSIEHLYVDFLLDRKSFDDRVTFRHADMRDLSDFKNESYDFIWSACAFEHLGTLDTGLRFVIEAMNLLKPGGIAVHTTEINVSSLDHTRWEGKNVIYRQKDLYWLDHELRKRSMCLERLDMFPGSHEHDVKFDYPPYYENGREHIKLLLDGHVTTSQLIIAHN